MDLSSSEEQGIDNSFFDHKPQFKQSSAIDYFITIRIISDLSSS